MEKFKPCPFCGNASQDEFVIVQTRYGYTYAVKCTACFAIGPSCESEDEAKLAWNERNVDMEDE